MQARRGLSRLLPTALLPRMRVPKTPHVHSLYLSQVSNVQTNNQQQRFGEVAMREPVRRNAMKTKARGERQPPYDPYASYGVDDSRGWVGPLPVKVVSVLDLTEDIHRSGIQRGMRVLDLGCGFGDVSLWIAKLVGPSGLVVGVDEVCGSHRCS